MNQHILTAVIYAKDLALVASFYENALYLSRSEHGRTFVLLESESFELTIVQIPEEISQGIETTVLPTAREETPIKLSFLVPSIEDARSRVVALGGILSPPDAVWTWRGLRHLDGTDPEGNVFQLREAGA